MATKNNRRQLKFDKNPIEALREVGSDVIKSASKATADEVRLDTNLAWEQLLGVKNSKKGEIKELKEGEEIIFSKKEDKAEAAPAINYVSEILRSETRISKENSRQLNVRIEELRVEIAKLAKSSKQLEVMVKDVSIEKVGSNVGKYHLNFFEWMLATLQTARIRVEESTSWLSVVSSKSSKKDYWSLSKKHGTSYMLSGERVVAQQTG